MKVLHYGQSEVSQTRGIGKTRWPFHDLFMLPKGATNLVVDECPINLNEGDIVLLAPGVHFFCDGMLAPSIVRVLHFKFSECGDLEMRELLEKKTSTVFKGVFNQPAIKRLIYRIAELYRPQRGFEDEFLVTHLTWSLLAELMKANEKREPEFYQSLAIRQVCEWAERNIGHVKNITQLAGRVGFSESHFRAMFRKVYGLSAGAWLGQIRMAEARRLLSSTNTPIKEISFGLGYSDVEAFHRAFVRSESLTPGRYRQLNPPVF